jgi:hypothetical protein
MNNGNNGNVLQAFHAGAAAAAAAPHANVKMAKKAKSTMRNKIKGAMKNPKTMTFGSKNARLKKTMKKKRANALNNARDPKEQVYKKINKYRKDAQVIYDKDIASIDKAKELIAIIDKLYHRMPTPQLREVVEVEIDVNGLAENILEAYNNILTKLEEKTKSANAHAVDELALLLGGLGF